MKNTFLILYILFFNFLCSAQKIKIDNGEVKIEEKTVAYIEGKKPLFTVYNLDKTYSVTLQLKFLADSGFGRRWMVVKDEKANKGNELDFKKFSPQNQEKSAVETLMTNGYLDANGLNEVALNTFLNNSPSGVSQKIFQEQNEIDKQNKAISDLKLSIDDSGNIYSKTSQNTDPIIGRINIVLKNGSVEKYEVVDLDNYIIGTWFASLGTFKGYDKFLNQEIITYDNKVFPIKFDNSGNFVGYKMSKDVTAMNIIFKLILNGYQLKHQFTNR